MHSATILVQDGDALKVLRRINVSDWSSDEINRTKKSFECIQKAGSQISHVVRLHTVLLQNTFLNVVTSYCEGGDLAAHLADRKLEMSEDLLFRWLLVFAQSVEEVQLHAHDCFYGLALDHIFIDGYLDDDRLYPSRMRVGIPTPRSSYFSVLKEKKTNSPHLLSSQYPPEVLESSVYHETLSDVWHLGKAARDLFHVAGLKMSDEGKRLVDTMMHASLQQRPPVDKVITAMSVLGHLSPHDAPLRAPAKEMVVSSPRAPPSRPRRRVHSADWMMTPTEVTPSSVERLNTHRSQQEPLASPRVAPTYSPRRRPDSARDDNWHRGAMERMEELQKLNPNTGSRRARSHNDSAKRSGGYAGRGEHQNNRYVDAMLDMQLNAGSTVPFHYDREERGRMDNNTRVIKQLIGGETSTTPLRRNNDGAAKQHANSRKEEKKVHSARGQLPPDIMMMEDSDDVRSSDIKKCIAKWKNNAQDDAHCVASSSEGVVIYTPFPHRGSSSAAEKPSKSRHSPQSSKRNARIPVSIAMPSNPPPEERQAPPPPPKKKDSPQVTSARAAPRQDVARAAPPPPAAPPSAPLSGRKPDPILPQAYRIKEEPPVASKNRSQGKSAPAKSRDISIRSDFNGGSSAALEWTVDSVRSSIRSLVKDRTRYGEVMLEVAAFLRKTEDERFSPEENGKLVRRLSSKMTLQDGASRDAAISLCSQLVALEGLRKLTKEGSK